ncbi:hypothetical protein L6452_41953 [Arctium lappa]|uniref:Uncharacterized protein n=1 Tax=Arctium lappa TaxID=4217 RepID=A0ACB8XH50_ARCLA|nr:hypothetical protein L6452_41953 [Arctium lappa]
MVDASMIYLAQKLFKVCNERQMIHIVVFVITDDANLTSICLDSHGTRVMQKLIELLSKAKQRSLIVSALRRITITLMKHTNGHHVIQNCLKSFHIDENKQQLPPMGNHFVANLVRSIFDRQDQYPTDFSTEFDPYNYCCNSCNPHYLFSASWGFYVANNSLFDSSSFYVGNFYPQGSVPDPVPPVNRNRSGYGISKPYQELSPTSRLQPKRTKFSASLRDIRGLICLGAKDQECCQFFQTKYEEGKAEDIEMISLRLKIILIIYGGCIDELSCSKIVQSVQ